jgi:hypothetical protein
VAQQCDAADGAFAAVGPLVSAITLISAAATARVATPTEISPLGGTVFVPELDFPVRAGDWTLATVTLQRLAGADEPQPHQGAGTQARATAEVATATCQTVFEVEWPDGRHTRTTVEIPDEARQRA